jgi:hypothetical protein
MALLHGRAGRLTALVGVSLSAPAQFWAVLAATLVTAGMGVSAELARPPTWLPPEPEPQVRQPDGASMPRDDPIMLLTCSSLMLLMCNMLLYNVVGTLHYTVIDMRLYNVWARFDVMWRVGAVRADVREWRDLLRGRGGLR